MRSLYGPNVKLGRIEGRLADNRLAGTLTPLNGVNVWAESVANGRVIASDVTAEDGSYKLEGLAPGQYRVIVASGSDTQKFRSFELSNQVAVRADGATPLNSNLVSPQPSVLNPRALGLNAELSTVALPLAPGKRVKIYLGGEGVDQVPGTSIAVNSPYFTIDPAISRANRLQRHSRSSASSYRSRQCAVWRLHACDCNPTPVRLLTCPAQSRSIRASLRRFKSGR